MYTYFTGKQQRLVCSVHTGGWPERKATNLRF